MIKMGLVMLPKLAVGLWIFYWFGLPGWSSSREKLLIFSFHCCHIYRTWKSMLVGGDFEVTKWGASHKGDGTIFTGEVDPQETKSRFTFGNCRSARLHEMVKKWGREMFIFHAIIPALYPFWWKFYWLS